MSKKQNNGPTQNREQNKIAIYQDAHGQIKVDVRIENETTWLTQAQIALLFDKDRTVITKHINNILKEEELDSSVCANFAHTASDGKLYKVIYYNLDMIISVGYRVNSKRGIAFRTWASNVLKEYLIKGYKIDGERLLLKEREELRQLVEQTLTAKKHLTSEELPLFSIIKAYTKSFDLLARFDEGDLHIPASGDCHNASISLDESLKAILSLKQILMKEKKASELFGNLREEDGLLSILSNLEQSFDGKDLYPNFLIKAAHLFYFIIKDRPFTDGNKRIACLLLLLFLKKATTTKPLPSNACLTALALLIAASPPKQKEIITKLTMNLLN